MYTLKIISSTTRPGRKGPIIAKWIADVAMQDPDWEIQVIDLGELNLPMLDEPKQAMMGNYEHEHSRRWSATIDEADAFIFVTAEYNYGYPAPLKNALDFLYREWAYKPAAIVSYGGVSAGTRASTMLRPVLSALNMMPLSGGLPIPMMTQFINEAGVFVPNEMTSRGAARMFAELKKWTVALKPMRSV
ncbi:MAG: NAD(P)H-dependent oxidoreductase [Bacteroidetes bacterium]|nr:NAD(P)H-dependent oxidoreductase [Bacteroidota bacterium]